MADVALPLPKRKRRSTFEMVQISIAVVMGIFLLWRLIDVLLIEQKYDAASWTRFALSGITVGSIYALIAIGYTLVYGILRMINFAHSEVFMVGIFAGYFVFEALDAIVVDAATELTWLHANAVPSIILAFLAGIGASMFTGFALERIAYRPLRNAPRLVPLISAIGASIFLQNAFQLMFSGRRRTYPILPLLDRNKGFEFTIGGKDVFVNHTAVFAIVFGAILVTVLYLVVQNTKLGRAMRAVSEDKRTAALMGIDVDSVISRTFLIAGALAGAAGVVWGIHYGQFFHAVGFIPGIKAFTAAVLGGIGNLPGAMLGAIFLGLIENIGPAILGIDVQLKDVIAFSILVLVLLFRPSGILGEALTEEKV